MAFLLATAFAFATDQKPSEDGSQTGEYISRNEPCEKVTVGCNNQSSTPCMYMGYQVFAKSSATDCDVTLTHQP